MKILKTMMAISDAEDGRIYKVDTIEHEGKFWIVPEWIDNKVTGWSSPTRIILLDVLPHQKSPGGPADFVLNYGMPKSVFYEGRIPPQPEHRFVVIENPDIKFPIRNA
jgi:hypothetical protein